MALPREHLLDELASAYVQAIVAMAGATIAVSRKDYGVDGTIRRIGIGPKERYFETGYPIDFQLKATSTVPNYSEIIKFDLKVRNYNLIVSRGPTAVPYFLFLVCFGDDENRWLDTDHQSLSLKAQGFWWHHSGPASGNYGSVRIEVPTKNRLTSAEVLRMLASSAARYAI